MSSSATKPTTSTFSRSRPTTPLRPSSRSSFRSSRGHPPTNADLPPLESFEPQFAELSDSMAALEANMMDLQLMHESLARFNESFASFMYGLNMNAYCVDFPEAPIAESFKRAAQDQSSPSHLQSQSTSISLQNNTTNFPDNETTFMTTTTDFVENPPPSSRSSVPKFATPAPPSRIAGGRGRGIPVSRGIPRGKSGLPSVRGRGRGLR